MERSKEYDAFGPWIYEIDEEHEIPKLFREYYSETAPLLLFKVPRSVERRKASPNMDLYDYLVGAYDTYLHIYKRAGKSVDEQKIDYRDIVAVRDVHALLRGELILFTPGGQVSLVYNTVSEDVVLKLINIIEDKISGAARNIAMESLPVEYVPGNDDYLEILFINLFNKLKETKPGVNLVALQPLIDIKRTRSLKISMEEKACAPSKLAFITNEKELIVLIKELPELKRQKHTYVYSYLYVPYQNIAWAAASLLDEEQALSVMELNAGGRTFSFIIESANAGVYELCNRLCGHSAA